MRSGEYVQRKLRAWAARQGLHLQGSQGDRGALNYTLTLEDNLFQRRLLPSVRNDFAAGAGGELKGDPCPMQALHSSAALAVNLFQYWVASGDYGTLAQILSVPSGGICGGAFERKAPVFDKNGGAQPPHLDFWLTYSDARRRVAIECKLFEPYGRLEHGVLSQAYLRLSGVWDELPACLALAHDLCRGGTTPFKRLGPVQLLRHILGLRRDANGAESRLVYLYMDAPGEEAAEHRREVECFARMIASDPILFVPLTMQAFILRAVERCRVGHTTYVDYLAERYL